MKYSRELEAVIDRALERIQFHPELSGSLSGPAQRPPQPLPKIPSPMSSGRDRITSLVCHPERSFRARTRRKTQSKDPMHHAGTVLGHIPEFSLRIAIECHSAKFHGSVMKIPCRDRSGAMREGILRLRVAIRNCESFCSAQDEQPDE